MRKGTILRHIPYGVDDVAFEVEFDSINDYNKLIYKKDRDTIIKTIQKSIEKLFERKEEYH